MAFPIRLLILANNSSLDKEVPPLSELALMVGGAVCAPRPIAQRNQ